MTGTPVPLWRRIPHFILVGVLAPIAWFVGMTFLAAALVAVVQADKLWPHATWGNCWSYVGPRWWKGGGYIGVRSADGVRMFWFGPVPHAIWLKSLPADAVLEQITPTRERYQGGFLFLRRGVYFEFVVKTTEEPHPARADDGEVAPRDPDGWPRIVSWLLCAALVAAAAWAVLW